MISIVIPFLNEEENLKILIPNLFKIEDNNFEYIFVNDGSTDNSEDVLFKCLNSLPDKPSYQYIKHGKKMGIGGVFKSAITKASGSHLTMLASDNEDNIDDIINSQKLINQYTTVMMYNKNSAESRSFFRRIVSILFRTYLNARFDTKILYFNAMGNIYKLEMLRKLNITSKGFFALAEIAIKINKMDGDVVHCPRTLSLRSSGKSNSATIRSCAQLLLDYKSMSIT